MEQHPPSRTFTEKAHAFFFGHKSKRNLIALIAIIALLALIIIWPHEAQAADATDQADSAETTAMMSKLKTTFPQIQFSSVTKTPVQGIYEVVFGKDLLYVEASGTYFFPTMINMVTQTNLGQERRDELNKVNFSELPLKDAIKTVNGKGTRKLVVFADPNCGYCKRLEGNLANLPDTTIYTFPVGILGQSSTEKSIAVVCAKGDKAKLWHSMLTKDNEPVMNNCETGSTQVQRNLTLFNKYGFQGTPGIILENGLSIKGYAENDRIEALIARK